MFWTPVAIERPEQPGDTSVRLCVCVGGWLNLIQQVFIKH